MLKKRIFATMLAMLLVPALPAASVKAEPIQKGAISSLTSFMEKNSPELSSMIAFAEGQATGYGSNGKFLAPIEEPDPYAIEIYTAQDLYDIRNDLSGSYVLMNNIDLESFGMWSPIGDDSNQGQYFSGTFDGQGYVISNLTIEDFNSTVQYNGLFGYINDATIKNMGLENTWIYLSLSSIAFVGGICGFADSNTLITNCYNTGDVTAYTNFRSAFVGGICGYKDYQNTISNCYNTGDVTSSSYSGGICGSSAYQNTISNCYNTGDVTTSPEKGAALAGGICGSIYEDSTIISCYNMGDVNSSSVYALTGGICGQLVHGIISDCYNTGDVSSTASSVEASAGGICGFSFDHGIISNCYNSGKVKTSTPSHSSHIWSHAGGICGVISYQSTISYCYNMGDVISSSSSYYAYAGGISGYNELCAITNCVVLSKKITANKNQYIIGNGGIKSGNLAITGITGNPIDDSDGRITKSQAQQQSTYTGIGWDFINVWNIDEGQSYPYLRNVIGLIDPSTEGKITAYMYDRLGRLTKIIFDSGVSVSYTYDSVGNILDVNVEVPLSYSLNSLSKRGGVE